MLNDKAEVPTIQLWTRGFLDVLDFLHQRGQL